MPLHHCHQFPRLLRVVIAELYVSEEVPRGPLLFSLDCEQDSERQDAEMHHLSRADDGVVVDSGAAVSSAPRTCAAHCKLKHVRQLTLHSATGHTPAFLLQLRGGEIDCSFTFCHHRHRWSIDVSERTLSTETSVVSTTTGSYSCATRRARHLHSNEKAECLCCWPNHEASMQLQPCHPGSRRPQQCAS